MIPPSIAILADNAPSLPWWSIIPFLLMLGVIALLPLIAPHFWHCNRNKALVSLLLAAPVALFLYLHSPESKAELGHSVREYVSFIVLLGSLYVVSGGLVIHGDIPAKPTTNLLILAAGAVLANII